jgi:2-iminobutanoate/2-iminopropanoate deaminase
VKQILFSAQLPSSSLYSQGVKVGKTIYLSGIVAFDPSTKKVELKTIEEQTERAIRNCELILRTGGANLEDVVQVIVLLKNPQDFDSMNKAYSKIFTTDPPTRAVSKLGVDVPNILVSMMMTASVAESYATIEAEEVAESEIPTIKVPEEKINYINKLGDSDKIVILWSMSDKDWMNVDGFLSSVAEVGISIAKSWSPKKGGNFNNRLFKEKKLFVKKEEGKESLYKLSAEGKQKSKELVENFQSHSTN